MFMCLVLGLILGDFAMTNAPEFSSNAVHLILGLNVASSRLCLTHSSRMCIIGITFRNASERLTYSHSVVLNAILVCNLEAQINGQPANILMNPDCECAVAGSSAEVSHFQSPPNDASA